MAKLQKADLLKRDNIAKFCDRINKGGQFKLGDADGKACICTGRYKFSDENNWSKNINPADVKVFCEDRQAGGRRLIIEVKETGSAARQRNFTEFYKDKEMGGVASKSGGGGSERQERGLIDLINESVFPMGTVKIDSFRTSTGLTEVKAAKKMEGMSALGKEPYIDILLVDKRGKEYGVSCKGDSAPSLAGGGLAGMKVVVPDLITKLYDRLERYIKQDLKLKDKQKVKIASIGDIYIKIPQRYIEKILVGTPQMGGPVTHMYVGSMDVAGRKSGSTLNITNGRFYTIEEYQRKIGDFYFRIRKRDVDSEPDGEMVIQLNKKNREGFPVLFEGATRQKNLTRIVIQGSVPSNATLLQL